MIPFLIVLIVIGGLLILLGLSLIAVDHVFHKTFNRRGDGSNSITYAHPSDYPELNIRHGYISSRKDLRLSYNVYKKDGVKIKASLLVIHGIGFGHYYLLPMIRKFCEDGYLVIAYDQFGSGASEGKEIETMSVALKDIPYVLNFIKSDEELSKYPLYVFGHSWGGYAAFSSPRYSKDIKKVVSISGFYNEGVFAHQVSFLVKLRNFFIVGNDAFFDNRKAVKHTDAKMYYLQGENDLVINPRFAGEKYAKLAEKCPNLKVELLPNKGHTPYNDDESQKEQDKVLGEFGLLGGVLVPIEHYIDFRKISKVDENVYQKIIDFYSN